jgi:hypothetical protein
VKGGKIKSKGVVEKEYIGLLKEALVFENKTTLTFVDWKKRMLDLNTDGTPCNVADWANHREASLFALMYNVHVFVVVNKNTGFEVLDSDNILKERSLLFLREMIYGADSSKSRPEIYLYHHVYGSPFKATVSWETNNHYAAL